ncbi:MAG: hypothetical protein IKR86_08595 [Candidatus Methanomethylophilaceae archaeon]|jgi:V/A-type H+-transporting ATPase subunit G/H|nr:hypothetical protein [Candidatus Methanomethylophilaceae archaeon]
MSRTDILSGIKQAEKDADALIDEAKATGKSVIAEARRNSVKKIQDAEAECRSALESAITATKVKLDSERAGLLKDGNSAAAAIEQRSTVKMQEVKDFLNKEFERTLNVTS